MGQNSLRISCNDTDKGKVKSMKKKKKKKKNKVDEMFKRSRSFKLRRCSNKVIKSKKNMSIISYDDFAADDDDTRCKEMMLRKKQPLPKPKLNPLPPPKPTLKRGDRVDITQLLFTKQRDYLIKSNSDQLVKADHLEGKVIVLFFASVYDNRWVQNSYHLTQVYNDIYHYSPFEVVFVALSSPPSYPPYLYPLNQPTLPLFDSIFSTMPWTAIPYSDLASRVLLQAAFGFHGTIIPNSPIIDPSGLVLCLHANSMFSSCGSDAYPFTDQRLRFLRSQDRALLQRPSITQLLTSPQRDYLLTNNGVKVPVLSLENKVVALHFYEEGQPLRRPDGTFFDITNRLIAAYKDLVKNHHDFEVVLIYLHDSWTTFGHTSEDSFWKKFKTMPWLALPYKDPVCKRLRRIFNYPLDLEDLDPDPRLVVVGPRGEFCEPFAADIFMDFGTEAYPFTRMNTL